MFHSTCVRAVLLWVFGSLLECFTATDALGVDGGAVSVSLLHIGDDIALHVVAFAVAPSVLRGFAAFFFTSFRSEVTAAGVGAFSTPFIPMVRCPLHFVANSAKFLFPPAVFSATLSWAPAHTCWFEQFHLADFAPSNYLSWFLVDSAKARKYKLRWTFAVVNDAHSRIHVVLQGLAESPVPGDTGLS